MTPVEGFLNEADPTAAFARFYLQEIHGSLMYVPHDAVSPIKIGSAVVLFRDPPFQVELQVFHPNTVIPEHSHPKVDTIVVYLCGDMSLEVAGQELFPLGSTPVRPTGHSARHGIPLRFPPGVKHAGKIGATGGALLSIQRWLEGPPKPLKHDWHGTDGSTEG